MVDKNPELSHVDAQGRARMVDVGGKLLTRRRAVAAGRVTMRPETLRLALQGGGPKGPVIEIARVAGIAGAKRTSDLVPLCHPLPLDQVDVEIAAAGDDALEIRAVAETTWRTGVEMEAFTAVAVAAVTLIDMLKAVDREMTITDVRLLEKSGGRHGPWRRGER
jgi:cyclic pyranopterin phosphate synthase